MEATRSITLSADRKSARRWRMTTGIVLVIGVVSLTLALMRPHPIERIPVLVRDVAPTQLAITSSAATHEAGPYASPGG